MFSKGYKPKHLDGWTTYFNRSDEPYRGIFCTQGLDMDKLTNIFIHAYNAVESPAFSDDLVLDIHKSLIDILSNFHIQCTLFDDHIYFDFENQDLD